MVLCPPFKWSSKGGYTIALATPVSANARRETIVVSKNNFSDYNERCPFCNKYLNNKVICRIYKLFLDLR